MEDYYEAIARLFARGPYEPYEPTVVFLHPYVCRMCEQRFLGPGSDPVECPHVRHGLCARCYRKVHVFAEEGAA